MRTKLAAAADGERQMVDILNAVLTDGLGAVDAACGEALREGVQSSAVILNILPLGGSGRLMRANPSQKTTVS